MKIKKHFVISLWYWRKRTKSYGNRSFSRTFQKMHRFLKKYIKTCHNNQQLKIKSVKANLQTRNFEARIKMRWKHWGKFDLWNIDLWILHIKISLYRIFMKIWEKKLTKFLRHFWLIEAKMKIKMKKYGKIIPIFEFFISKSDFIKICEKKIDLFYTTFLTNREKNENNDEKMRKNESDFWIIHIKTKLCGNFHENPRKKFLTNWGKMKMKKKKFGKMKSIFEFSIWKIRLCSNIHENPRKKTLTRFLKIFWLIEIKMKMKMKNIGKMSLIFELSILKLGFLELSIKIWEKSFLKFLPKKDILGQRCWKS